MKYKSQDRGQCYAIILIIISSFIYHFAYDQFQPIMKPIIEQYDLSVTSFNAVCGISDLSNILLPFFLPHLVKTLRPENLLLVSVFTISTGQLVIAFSALNKSFYLLVIGRLILGSLRELSMIAQQILLRRHLSRAHFGVVMAIQPTIMAAIKIFNVYVVPKILLHTESLTTTLFICWLISQISIISAMNYLLIETHDHDDDDEIVDYITENNNTTENSVLFLAGLLFLAQMLQAGCYKSFTNIASDLIQKTYQLSIAQTSKVLLIHYAAFALFNPMVVLLCLKYKVEKEIFAMSTVFIAAALAINIWYTSTVISAIASMVLYSGFWSMRTSTVFVFVSKTILCEKSLMGFGLSAAVEALGSASIPIIIATLSGIDLNAPYTYTGYLNNLLSVTLFTFLIATFWILRYTPKEKND